MPPLGRRQLSQLSASESPEYGLIMNPLSAATKDNQGYMMHHHHQPSQPTYHQDPWTQKKTSRYNFYNQQPQSFQAADLSQSHSTETVVSRRGENDSCNMDLVDFMTLLCLGPDSNMPQPSRGYRKHRVSAALPNQTSAIESSYHQNCQQVLHPVARYPGQRPAKRQRRKDLVVEPAWAFQPVAKDE